MKEPARSINKVLNFNSILIWYSITLIERKSRMPKIQGGKGEAVVNYCEPLTTPKIGYHRLS